MAIFPTKESEILVLAETMISGYTIHAADFPSITTSAVSDLSAVLDNYPDRQELSGRCQGTGKARYSNER